MGCCNSYPLTNFSSRYKKISSEDQYLISYTDSIAFSSFDFQELYAKLTKFSNIKIIQEDLESFFIDANIGPSLLKINSSTSAILQKICERGFYDLKFLKLFVILLGKGNYHDKCLTIFKVYDLCLKSSYLNKKILLQILCDLVSIVEMIIPEKNSLDDSPDIVKSCIKDYCGRFLDEKLRVFDKILKIVFKKNKEILCVEFIKMLEKNHSLCALFNANSLRLLLIDEVVSHETSTLFEEMYPKINDSPLVLQKPSSPSFINRRNEGKILPKPAKNYSIQVESLIENKKSVFEADWEKKILDIPKINLNIPEIKPVILSDCERESTDSMSTGSSDMNSSLLFPSKLQSRVRSSSSTEDLTDIQLIPQNNKRGILKRHSSHGERNKKKPSTKSVSFSIESIGNKKQSALEPIILRVNLGENNFENVQLNPGENPTVVASTFAIKNRLTKQDRDELIKSLRSLIVD